MKTKIFLLASITAVLLSCSKKSIGPDPENGDSINLLKAAAITTPKISGISGNSDGVGVLNARWTGNPHPNGCANFTNLYLNYYVVDCYNYGSAALNPYYWDINGTSFGTVQGSVSISGMSVLVVSWTDTKIRVKPSAGYNFGGMSGGTVKITKPNSGGSCTFSITPGIIPILKSRGLGQCTYEVAFRRIGAGKALPPSAYSTSGSINSAYIPQQWDVLFWSFNSSGSLSHTGIITSAVTSSGTGTGKTYTFTLTERNAYCDERVTTKICTFKPLTNTGIYSLGSSTKQAAKYFR